MICEASNPVEIIGGTLPWEGKEAMTKMRASPRTPSRAELLAAVRCLMPDGLVGEAIRTLDRYPGPPASRVKESPERVQMAALALSGGSLELLRQNVEVAVRDYRDLLAGASTMPWAAEYRAVELQLGEAGLSPWAQWLGAEG